MAIETKTIQIRQGSKADLQAMQLLPGEQVLALDTGEVGIKSAGGDIIWYATLTSAGKIKQMPSAEDVGAVPTGRTVNGKALSANITLSSADVGAIPTSQKGAASGVASLGSDSKLIAAQIPQLGAVTKITKWNLWTYAGSPYPDGEYYRAPDGLVVFEGLAWKSGATYNAVLGRMTNYSADAPKRRLYLPAWTNWSDGGVAVCTLEADGYINLMYPTTLPSGTLVRIAPATWRTDV